MEMDNRLVTLENEFKVLKAEIRHTLLDVKSMISGYDGPVGTPSGQFPAREAQEPERREPSVNGMERYPSREAEPPAPPKRLEPTATPETYAQPDPGQWHAAVEEPGRQRMVPNNPMTNGNWSDRESHMSRTNGAQYSTHPRDTHGDMQEQQGTVNNGPWQRPPGPEPPWQEHPDAGGSWPQTNGHSYPQVGQPQEYYRDERLPRRNMPRPVEISPNRDPMAPGKEIWDINVTTGLIRWAGMAKQELKEEQIQGLLDVCNMSGHLSPDVRRFVEYLACPKVPEECGARLEGMQTGPVADFPDTAIDLLLQLYAILAGAMKHRAMDGWQQYGPQPDLG